MNKKLLELLNAISAKKTEVKNLVAENKLEEAQTAKDELIALQNKFDILKDLEDDEPVIDRTNATPVQTSTPENTFAQNVRRLPSNTMVEGTDANGGYIVPQDVQTRINHYKETHRSMRDFVSVEPVTTNKGSRVYEKRAELSGFAKVDETGKLQAIGEPQFEQVQYDIQDFGGYLPVSNDLLHDTDANLESELVNWIGRNSLATDNRELFALAANGTKVALTAGINGIKKAVTVTVGSAYDSVIITNDDGANYLDTLEDKNGRPLLNPDPTDSTRLQLRCGAKVVSVEIFPNADLPSDTKTTAGKTIIPFIIGDTKEAFHVYDRQQTTMFASNVANVVDADGKSVFNAFQQRGTLYRADMRADYKTVDSKAFVYGQMTVANA